MGANMPFCFIENEKNCKFFNFFFGIGVLLPTDLHRLAQINTDSYFFLYPKELPFSSKYITIKKEITMKKNIGLITILVIFLGSGCRYLQKNEIAVNSPEQALTLLKQGNDNYINSKMNKTDISRVRREDTSINGQKPYAVIVTCSDSRVPPEHIFSAGIGDLFVIRSAGNVIDDFGLGSIEYGVKHLGAKVIVVLGHNQCGAVSAALAGHIEGYITSIVNEIKPGIEGATDTIEAERLNIEHSFRKIHESEIIMELLELNEIAIFQAIYNLQTGKADFF